MIELWNVHDGVPVYAGAQNVLNILGRLNNWENVDSFVYSLNGGPDIQVFFRNKSVPEHRLAKYGDFNIDTITKDQLRSENQLRLIVNLKDGRRVARSCALIPKLISSAEKKFTLDLRSAEHTQELGQIVDGNWRLYKDKKGEAYLEIRPEDAGLDRILLFGNDELRSDYTILARLQVNRWMKPLHNVGLLFKWNPHLQGDGGCLPGQWTTGLGYYYSHCRGLRIRIGVNVHLNERRMKVGDNILGEAFLSPLRYWMNRIVRKSTRGRFLVPQIVPGLHYWFELNVSQDGYTLTVWPDTCSRPSPQIVVNAPPELLDKGAVGIIAHYCAVRLFEFHLQPHKEPNSCQ